MSSGIDVEQLTLPDGELGYTDSHGSGRPVLLVHAGVFADWFAPLAARPELSDQRVIRVRRVGYTQRADPPRGLTIGDHAVHSATLLDALGIQGADVLGHSSGALISLDLARRRPDLVSRLFLFEPAPGGALAESEAGDSAGQIIGRALESAGAGDVASAFDIFMSNVCARDYRAVLTEALGPEGLDQAVLESAYFFRDEVAAVLQWPFGSQEAAAVEQTVVLAVGGASPPPVHEVVDRLAGWLPHSQRVTIDGADHLLPLRDPEALARMITGAESSLA